MTYSFVRDPITGTLCIAFVVRDADNAQIPSDTINADWRAYQAWLALGNHTATPPPLQVPPSAAAPAA